MITEDYVSFETAELLEKKGFDENCVSAYQYGELTLVSSLGLRYELGAGDLVITFSNSERKWNPEMISAPTLQMAMKWLREVHNISIGVSFSCEIIMYEIQKNGKTIKIEGSSRTYEKMVDEAIKYCLENLI